MLTGKPVWDFNPQTTTEEHLRKIAHELTKIPPAVSKDTGYVWRGSLCSDWLLRCYQIILLCQDLTAENWQTFQVQKGRQTVPTMNSTLRLVLKNGVSRKKRSFIPLLGQMMQKSWCKFLWSRWQYSKQRQAEGGDRIWQIKLVPVKGSTLCRPNFQPYTLATRTNWHPINEDNLISSKWQWKLTITAIVLALTINNCQLSIKYYLLSTKVKGTRKTLFPHTH